MPSRVGFHFSPAGVQRASAGSKPVEDVGFEKADLDRAPLLFDLDSSLADLGDEEGPFFRFVADHATELPGRGHEAEAEADDWGDEKPTGIYPYR